LFLSFLVIIVSGVPMLTKSESSRALQRLFRRFPVVDLEALSRTLQTRSRMSIFRRLREIGYFSSYTHTGRYYTLADIPQFDDYGLWMHQGIGFSQFGSLKATIVELVNRSPIGHTHMELNNLLRIRVHNTLLSVVRERRVGRQRIDKAFLYVSAEPHHASEQISRRTEQLADSQKAIPDIPIATVIEVLIETLHAGQVLVAPSLVAKRLCARAVPVTTEQIERVFTQYGIEIEKKTL
jgi:hypothetical protein